MDPLHFQKIAGELSLTVKQVETTARLLAEGGTVPFISRYRKEMTGNMDEVQITAVRDRLEQLQELDKRREAILKSLTETGNLSQELEKLVRAAESMVSLEDLYLPYRPKRKTRASAAREKGLQPLAQLILEQNKINLPDIAATYINSEKGVGSVEEALAGARDIIAEQIAEDPDVRLAMRTLFWEKGSFVSTVFKGKEEEGQKYKDYFDWTEPARQIPSHRYLAIRRAEKELILSLDVQVPVEEAHTILYNKYIHSNNSCADEVRLAGEDSFKRLLKPAMETETRLAAKKKADVEAIRVFAENARQLLLAAPAGQKRTIAIDPGFRTGCKVVCLDEQGKLLENTAIYPHNGAGGVRESEAVLRNLATKHQIEAIAIGNGTAGRETEAFVRGLKLENMAVVMVNESGASIYSASEAAREEFPDKDITVKGAVSIGRRFMDPLAELVKIDPQSIGVGQYQHDVDQSQLKTSLDDTVISCVNSIGVELNTASKQLLSYVSGLGPQLAKNIVEYRDANGAFRRRADLKKIPRLGEKAFEQAAGFLRIRNAEHPLDASAVHPERYALVERMAKDMNCSLQELMKDPAMRSKIKLENYITGEVGLPTLKDILNELARPGVDPREKFEVFSFSEGINAITDLHVGMTLPGIVTNITAFGAFVDIGVHQDGLIHLSQMSDRFIKDPNEVLKVNQKVNVRVTEVDVNRKRIALSMKSENARPAGQGKAPRKEYDGKESSRRDLKQDRHPKRTIQREQAPETDIAIKLAALKNKFS